MSNSLLQDLPLPAFSQFSVDEVQPAISQILKENRAAIAQLLTMKEAPTWANFVDPIEEISDRLSKAWSPVSHLNSVMNSDELREAYNACLPLLSEYSTELGQNQALYERYLQVQTSTDFANFNVAQQKAINNELRDFKLAGVALEDTKKNRYGEIKKRLSELSTKFSENVLDATNAWKKHITDVNELAGLPDSALALAQQTAQQQSLDGYLITLDFPSYMPVITYANNKKLREEIYTAFSTRASDQGPQAGSFDNSKIIDETLALRHELSQVLGFNNFAEYSIATKMANTTDEVVEFLESLAKKAKPAAEQELKNLQQYAQEKYNEASLEAWDIAYYGEKLRQHEFSISQEQLRPYFPITQVMNGMFEVAKRLFSIDIEKIEGDVWHKDVNLFCIKQKGEVKSYFYLDPFARDKKRGGAWMDECRVRRRLPSGELQIPVAYLVCNFTPPVGDQDALITHDEVTTLFHEFGHGLHHMLTNVEVGAVSGINGVAWDAVELPSQLMENWCWEEEALEFISAHFETQQSLPQDLLNKMLAAKNFQTSMMMVRQIEFSLFDFVLHKNYSKENNQSVQTVLDNVRSSVSVITPPSFNRFQNGFSHIFAGGYSAGYYSYKWAEVLSADVFSKFEEDGIFNKNTGQAFLDKLLSQGGSQNPDALFKDFRGRAPTVDALLKHSGIKV
jgi:oligopeptidase A